MPLKCFVPGCKSGYVSTIKENIKAGIRNPSMFSAPKDLELLEEWNRLILRKDRKLTSKDSVCELHFEEECIEKNYSTLLPDKTLHIIPRVRNSLKKGSVPTIFPDLPTYVSFRRTKRDIPTSLNRSSKNKFDVFESDSEDDNFIINEESSGLGTKDLSAHESLQKSERKVTAPFNCSSENKLKNFERDLESKSFVIPEELSDLGTKIYVIPDEQTDSVNKNIVIPKELSNLEVKVYVLPEEPGDPRIKDVVIPEEPSDLGIEVYVIPQEQNDFPKISVEAKSISKPNSLWSVVCTDNCIIFAKWNTNFCPERRVIVCKDLSTKVFLMNVEVPLFIESCTKENLENLLERVNDITICSNADSGASSGCLGILEDRNQEFCSICRKSNFKSKSKKNCKKAGRKKKTKI